MHANVRRILIYLIGVILGTLLVLVRPMFQRPHDAPPAPAHDGTDVP